MKGISTIAQYIVSIAIGMIVLIGFIFLIQFYYSTVIENEIRESLNQIAIHTSDAIIRLQSEAKDSKALPEKNSAILISEIDLKLPEKVANKNYEILLVSPSPIFSTVTSIFIDGKEVFPVEGRPLPKLILKTREEPIIKVERVLPLLDVIVQGKAERSTKLTYWRVNINDTIEDWIILGDQKIFIDINSIS